MGGTEESITNLSQATEEVRAAVTNLTGTNMNLTTQVGEYANHLETNDSNMANMEKTTIQIYGGIKTLKRKLAVQTTIRTGAAQNQYKEFNWWSSQYS